MQIEQAKSLFSQADELINLAQAELNRAKEDVVPHQICSNTRHAIALYLKSFLSKHGMTIPQTTDLNVLLDVCRKSDAKFQKLDLTGIECSAHYDGHAFCSNVNRVEECFDIARVARNLVSSDPWPESVHTK